MNYTDIRLQTLQDNERFFILENNIRGGISSVTGDRYIKSNGTKKIVYIDAINLYGWALCESLHYDEFQVDKIFKLEGILNFSDDSDIGYFFEVDLFYPDNIKEKTKNFPISPEKKIIHKHFTPHMNKNKPNTFTQAKKIIFDWNDNKNYLTHYGMLKFFIRHGMIVDKVLEINWFDEKDRNLAKNECEEGFYNLLNNSFSGRTIEIVRNWI